jgi:hypothetical protein
MTVRLVAGAALGALALSGCTPVSEPASSADNSGSEQFGLLPTPGMTEEQMYPWAEQLPRGDDADVAFVVDGRIVVAGGDRLELPKGTQVELEATLPDGWLVQHGTTDEHGNWVDIRTGVLSEDGSFRPFEFDAEKGDRGYAVRGLVASPDGDQVAYDGQVVDVATGKAVAEIPGKPLVLRAWTEHGLEYLGRVQGRLVPIVWASTAAKPVAMTAFDTFEGPDLLAHYIKDCAGYWRLGAEGKPTRLIRLCGEGVADVTESGRILTTTGRVLDESGKDLAALSLPAQHDNLSVLPELCCGLHWESDDAVLLTVAKRGPTGSPFRNLTTLLVRCTLDERGQAGPSCERASEPLANVTWPYFQPLPG